MAKTGPKPGRPEPGIDLSDTATGTDSECSGREGWPTHQSDVLGLRGVTLAPGPRSAVCSRRGDISIPTRQPVVSGDFQTVDGGPSISRHGYRQRQETRDKGTGQFPAEHKGVQSDHGSIQAPSSNTRNTISKPRVNGETGKADRLGAVQKGSETHGYLGHSEIKTDNLAVGGELRTDKGGLVLHDSDTRNSDSDCTENNRPPSVRSEGGMPPDKVIINVGGERFVTFATTLYKTPGTRLSMLTKSDPSYDSYNGEYFFDRNPKLFAYILDFYRTGELHFPHSQCSPLLKKELEFWAISEDYIAPCCWKTFTEYEEEQKTLQILESSFNGYKQQLLKSQRALHTLTGCKKWRQDLWIFLEDPNSSWTAKVFAHVYVFLLLASIAVVVMETDPMFRVSNPPQLTPALQMRSHPSSFTMNSTNQKLQMYLTTEAHISLIITDYICTFFFSMELFVRFAVWPGKLTFFRSVFNIIDLFSVAPMLINTLVTLVQPSFWVNHDLFVGYCVLSVSSVFRSIRILKLVKHNRGLQIIWLAMKASLKEILLLILLMAIGTLVFSTMIYYAEFEEADNFVNIPIGFWWSIVTMTTVGYGDKTPRTALGYVVGSLCAVSGMLITGLPIPVIANSFHLYNQYARIKNKLEQQRAFVRSESCQRAAGRSPED